MFAYKFDGEQFRKKKNSYNMWRLCEIPRGAKSLFVMILVSQTGAFENKELVAKEVSEELCTI